MYYGKAMERLQGQSRLKILFPGQTVQRLLVLLMSMALYILVQTMVRMEQNFGNIVVLLHLLQQVVQLLFVREIVLH